MAKVKTKTKSKTKRKNARPTAGSNAKVQTLKDYLAGVPQLARERVIQLGEAIRSVVPRESVEVISYGIPAFKHGKVLVWYAAFAKHCSLFPSASVINEFKEELKGWTVSKGTVQLPHDKPLPIPLIKKMVKARVAQSAGK
jgi:uncharacterized protein YdhG (YjbR/CyaY superfamily)